MFMRVLGRTWESKMENYSDLDEDGSGLELKLLHLSDVLDYLGEIGYCHHSQHKTMFNEEYKASRCFVCFG